MPRTAAAILAVCLATLASPEVRADGGTVRGSARVGAYLVTAFTSPTPPRAGAIDVSVLVQDASTSQPRLDLPVHVSATQGEHVLHEEATSANAENKLFKAAHLTLPTSGRWEFEVQVESQPPLRFALEVDPPLPGWLSLAGWIAFPAAAVLLFAIHRGLVARRRRG